MTPYIKGIHYDITYYRVLCNKSEETTLQLHYTYSVYWFYKPYNFWAGYCKINDLYFGDKSQHFNSQTKEELINTLDNILITNIPNLQFLTEQQFQMYKSFK